MGDYSCLAHPRSSGDVYSEEMKNEKRKKKKKVLSLISRRIVNDENVFYFIF